MTDMKSARSKWWTALTHRGDPMRLGNLAFDAFEAGWEAAKGSDADVVIERQRVEADEWMRLELDRMARKPAAVSMDNDPVYRAGDITHTGCIVDDKGVWRPSGQILIRRSKRSQAERHGWRLDTQSGDGQGELIIVTR